MKVIFIGDIVGRPGRDATKKLLPKLKKDYKPDFIIANGENVSGGKGISSDHLDDLHKAGIDFFTSGNHIWQQKDILTRMDERDPLVIRPANFPPMNPGKGWRILQTALLKRLLVINLQGRVFMHKDYDCPFRIVDKILMETAHEHLDGVFVDFHAEATSEKVSLGHYLDGRVSMVVGTHTHVPTADARIMPKGTGYLTDVGMVGLKESAIGVDKDPIIKSFISQMPVKHEITNSGPASFAAIYFETGGKEGNTKKVEQILLEVDL
ncbi:MAG: hypothetical protein ACD_65C00043G0001 [uncultured bacterium]|nr:MAG: hypothetical protein ACD_65C00043G0001 [uncultured bacterium]KKT02076.1 MAG: hypothetical protein UV80_C0006G0066 [Candidatus Peregrinibacteria bacterium GW2011_GWF2_43_17]KKT19423.1 MAG: Metallophosphoesterase [Candidatus Peregrinibacteria bacterium GW2011_GWA2_43_8]HAU40122.1 TIGR00282 family metallophosphoesterase [Candidatus Peregrinibacteria bacterium]